VTERHAVDAIDAVGEPLYYDPAAPLAERLAQVGHYWRLPLEQRLERVILDLLKRTGDLAMGPDGAWHFTCDHQAGQAGACPNNADGLCRVVIGRLPLEYLHPRTHNNWKCPCG